MIGKELYWKGVNRTMHGKCVKEGKVTVQVLLPNGKGLFLRKTNIKEIK